MNPVEQEIRTIVAGSPYFHGDTSLASPIDRSALEYYQVQRINEMVDYARELSPFYRDHLRGIQHIASLDEMPSIPFVTTEDLKHKPARLLCMPLSGVARVFAHFTTGTLGRPKKIFFSESDINRVERSMSSILANVIGGSGLVPDQSRIAIYLPNNGRPLSMAQMIAEGGRMIGAKATIGECGATTDEQIETILGQKPDVLMGSAFRIWRITQVGRDKHDLGAAGVKAIFITSEYLSSTMRARLEKAWGATVFHHYGMTEPGFAIGIECANHNGFHYNEANLFFEVVAPDTGMPVEDGEEGELVFTSLVREAMPLIRYRTGDIASITKHPCPCGSTLMARIGTMPKKLGLIYTLGTGETIYAALFDEALYEQDDLIDYRIFLTREEGRDQLLCQAEKIGNKPDFENRLAKRILKIAPVEKAIKKRTLSYPMVEVVPRETLRRGGRSLKRKIEDNRDQPVTGQPCRTPGQEALMQGGL